MFGYIRPSVGELKVRQHNKYKAIYCGLCKSLGKNNSQAARLGLQYDMAAFAYLIAELAKESYIIKDGNCIMHPIKKRPIAKDNETLSYCSNITSLLSYNKLQDMWLDEKKAYAPVGKALLRSGYKKAKTNYTKLDKEIISELDTLHGYEQDLEKCFDYPASTTANIMEAIGYNAPIKDINQKRALANLMRNLGIWIYLADAVDDIADDIKTGNYNPLVDSNMPNAKSIKLAKDVMTYSLVQATKARDLLPLGDAGEFIDNIIFISLPETMNRIFNKINNKKA